MRVNSGLAAVAICWRTLLSPGVHELLEGRFGDGVDEVDVPAVGRLHPPDHAVHRIVNPRHVVAKL